jgi:hypothetical protein
MEECLSIDQPNHTVLNKLSLARNVLVSSPLPRYGAHIPVRFRCHRPTFLLHKVLVKVKSLSLMQIYPTIALSVHQAMPNSTTHHKFSLRLVC